MSGQVNFPPSERPAANAVSSVGSAELRPFVISRGAPLAPQSRGASLAPQSSIFSCSSCPSCFSDLGRSLYRGFRACIRAIVTCLIDCCLYCFPARNPRGVRGRQGGLNGQQGVQGNRNVQGAVAQVQDGPRYSPEAQQVVDYIALVNRVEPRAEPQELNAAYAALSERIRTHISTVVNRQHGQTINDLVARYRSEERKGQAPSDSELRSRAISEFIQHNPRDLLILEALQTLIPPRRGN